MTQVPINRTESRWSNPLLICSQLFHTAWPLLGEHSVFSSREEGRGFQGASRKEEHPSSSLLVSLLWARL